MIIPIGHEESEVRRWPWVSFAIMAICLLALLATNGDAHDPKWQEGVATLEDAAEMWRQRAYLDASPEVRSEVGFDVSPNQHEQSLEMLRIEADPPASLLRFVPILRGEKRSDEASRALRDAVSPANRGLMPAQAIRVVELARTSDPAVALAAARRALESPELVGPSRAKLEQQLSALEQAAAAAPPIAEPKPERAPEPAPADRSLALDLGPDETPTHESDVSVAGPALEARWTDVKAVEAGPTGLDDGGLAIALAGGRAELGEEGPLRLVRLRSDRFDPRRLAAGATPIEAFRTFLNLLATRANAALLPDPESFRGGAFAKFADLESWQREVLKVG